MAEFRIEVPSVSVIRTSRRALGWLHDQIEPASFFRYRVPDRDVTVAHGDQPQEVVAALMAFAQGDLDRFYEMHHIGGDTNQKDAKI